MFETIKLEDLGLICLILFHLKCFIKVVLMCCKMLRIHSNQDNNFHVFCNWSIYSTSWNIFLPFSPQFKFSSIRMSKHEFHKHFCWNKYHLQNVCPIQSTEPDSDNLIYLFFFSFSEHDLGPLSLLYLHVVFLFLCFCLVVGQFLSWFSVNFQHLRNDAWSSF